MLIKEHRGIENAPMQRNAFPVKIVKSSWPRPTRTRIKLQEESERKGGVLARWRAIAIFQPTELNFKANPPCFRYARARWRAKWLHKLRADRMLDAKMSNYLALFRPSI